MPFRTCNSFEVTCTSARGNLLAQAEAPCQEALRYVPLPFAASAAQRWRQQCDSGTERPGESGEGDGRFSSLTGLGVARVMVKISKTNIQPNAERVVKEMVMTQANMRSL